MEIQRLHLTDITPREDLPWTRPTFPVFGFLVLHDDGPLLIDTGVGTDSTFIDDLYAPVHYDLDSALAQHGVEAEDVRTVITSHLHFDHCGQNARFGHARIYVQQSEIDAASERFYTVPEWAFPPGVSLTGVTGDHDVAPGVRIIATPGHSPGHQSVLVEDGVGVRSIVCCQASWSATSFGDESLGDDGWNVAVGDESVRRLHALSPQRVLLSHDAEDWVAP